LLFGDGGNDNDNNGTWVRVQCMRLLFRYEVSMTLSVRSVTCWVGVCD